MTHELLEQRLVTQERRAPEAHAPSYSSTHRALEITGILVVAVLTTEAALRVMRAINDPALAWIFAAAVAVGWVAADVASGFGHWAADTYGSEQTPVLGRHFIRPFRHHHDDPEDIVHHDFIETCGNSCIAVAVVLGIAFWSMPNPRTGVGWFFAWTALLVMLVATVVTNQFHKWAHMAVPPAPALVLQRLGVILSRETHAVHHVAPFRTYYCITTGWMNRPFQRARVYETLEGLLARCGARVEGAGGASSRA